MPGNTASAPAAAVSAAPIVLAKRRQPSYCSLVICQRNGQEAGTRHFDDLDDALEAFYRWFHDHERSVKRIMHLRTEWWEDKKGWSLPAAYLMDTEYARVETVYLPDNDQEDEEGGATVAEGGEEVEEEQEDEEEAEEEAATAATSTPTDARSQTVGRTPTPPAESHAPSETLPAAQASPSPSRSPTAPFPSPPR